MITLSIDRNTGELITPIENLDATHQDAIALALVRAARAIQDYVKST